MLSRDYHVMMNHHFLQPSNFEMLILRIGKKPSTKGVHERFNCESKEGIKKNCLMDEAGHGIKR